MEDDFREADQLEEESLNKFMTYGENEVEVTLNVG